MNRTEKEAFVAEFRSRLGRAPAFYLTDFTGLDVKSMTALRALLKDQGAEFLVVKNRLVKMALAELDLEEITDALNGPTGVVFGYEGAVEPAKVLSDFAREHDDRPVFKIGVLDNRVLEAVEIERIAGLPPRPQLLVELAGAMHGPIAALAGALQAKIQELAGLLEALGQERGQGA